MFDSFAAVVECSGGLDAGCLPPSSNPRCPRDYFQPHRRDVDRHDSSPEGQTGNQPGLAGDRVN